MRKIFEIKNNFNYPSLNERLNKSDHVKLSQEFKNNIIHEVHKKLRRKGCGNLEKIRIVFNFNNNIDTDNNIFAVKYFVDTLISVGLIKDDNTKVFESLCIERDYSLDFKTFKFTVYGE